MPVLLQNVDLSWSQQTKKHLRFDICLEGAMTRWTWNGAQKKQKKTKNKKQKLLKMSMLLTKRGTAIYYIYKDKKQCFTCILHGEQKQQVAFQRQNFSYSSQPARMWKEAMTNRKQLFIRTHIHKVPGAVSAIFQDCGAIHICLSCTQIPKINTHSSSTERGLLLSHMLYSVDTAVSI